MVIIPLFEWVCSQSSVYLTIIARRDDCLVDNVVSEAFPFKWTLVLYTAVTFSCFSSVTSVLLLIPADFVVVLANDCCHILHFTFHIHILPHLPHYVLPAPNVEHCFGWRTIICRRLCPHQFNLPKTVSQFKSLRVKSHMHIWDLFYHQANPHIHQQ